MPIIFHEPADEIAHHKKIIRELRQHSLKYAKLFQLGEWEIHIRYEEGPVDSDGKLEDISFESATASCDSQPEYFTATIKFFIKALIQKNRLKQLEVYARHEMLHVVLSPFTHFINNLLSEVDGREDSSFAATTGLQEETLVSTMEGWKFWDDL